MSSFINTLKKLSFATLFTLASTFTFGTSLVVADTPAHDSPANAAFGKDGSLLLTNHAFATMIPADFTVLDVFVDDKESALVRPSIP